MLLGKRGRPPMKRTTSMKEFTMDLNSSTVEGAYQPLDPHNPFNSGGGGLGSAAASPGPHRRKSADFVQTAHFMRVCSLCKCRLIPGHDIYMYRGDTAFCSLRVQTTEDDTRREEGEVLIRRRRRSPSLRHRRQGRRRLGPNVMYCSTLNLP